MSDEELLNSWLDITTNNKESTEVRNCYVLSTISCFTLDYNYDNI